MLRSRILSATHDGEQRLSYIVQPPIEIDFSRTPTSNNGYDPPSLSQIAEASNRIPNNQWTRRMADIAQGDESYNNLVGHVQNIENLRNQIQTDIDNLSASASSSTNHEFVNRVNTLMAEWNELREQSHERLREQSHEQIQEQLCTHNSQDKNSQSESCVSLESSELSSSTEPSKYLDSQMLNVTVSPSYTINLGNGSIRALDREWHRNHHIQRINDYNRLMEEFDNILDN